MKKTTVGSIAGIVVFACALLAVPRPADAALKLGVDGIWVPVSADRVESGKTALDSSHKVASFGGSLNGRIGFEIFSIGLKLNYFNEGLEIENEGVRRNQIDVNALARIGIPATKFALFTEGGASLSTSFDGVGYNVGMGAEYAIVKLPLVQLHLGTEGQYVNLPAKLNDLETDNQSVRWLLFVGVDFGP